MKTKNKYYSMFSNFAYVLSSAWEDNKLLFFFFGGCNLAIALQPFIDILFPKWIINELVGSKKIQSLCFTLSTMFILSSINIFISNYFRNISTAKVIKTTYKFTEKHTKVNLETDYSNTENSEFLNKMESANRALYDVNNGVQGILNIFFSLVGYVLGLFGYIYIIGHLNPFIILFIILTVSITFIFSNYIKKYEYSKNDEMSQYQRESDYAYSLMSDFSYGKEIRVYSLADTITTHYVNAKDKYFTVLKDLQKHKFALSIANAILSFLRDGIIYGYLIYLSLKNTMAIGTFLMYFSAISGFSNWILSVLNGIADSHSQKRYINDLRGYLDNNIKTIDYPKDMPINSTNPLSIEFRNVSFCYPQSKSYAIKNFSLAIPAGQKLAIVGSNGAGKTTLIKLLCRLYEPTEGEILVNGVDIRTYSKHEYYKLLSTVFQEIVIFAFSIGENIALSNFYDKHKVMQCLNEAGIQEKVENLERGLDTPLLKILDDTGVEFSGGENQRISLARALYKNGSIVILDEPTSALDPIAEYDIYNKFNEIINSKTALFISHRLSSTRFCDKVAFLERGRLIEYGSHNELLQLNGKYAAMFNLQAHYYKSKEN